MLVTDSTKQVSKATLEVNIEELSAIIDGLDAIIDANRNDLDLSEPEDYTTLKQYNDRIETLKTDLVHTLCLGGTNDHVKSVAHEPCTVTIKLTHKDLDRLRENKVKFCEEVESWVKMSENTF